MSSWKDKAVWTVGAAAAVAANVLGLTGSQDLANKAQDTAQAAAQAQRGTQDAQQPRTVQTTSQPK